MKKRSAGLLMFRRHGGILEVLLAHPGGPFWAKKDLGVWSLPKGEYDEGEAALAAAQREFREETGFACAAPFIPLGELKQASGKIVMAWAFEGDCDPATMASNTFETEWPPKSGKMQSFPEVDRVAWFGTEEARRRIHPGQRGFIEALERILDDSGQQPPSR
jgi:predicted NUDIX family NTP pyrophosphohydrolase